MMQIAIMVTRNSIVRKFQAGEVCKTLMQLPPCKVASVNNFRPRRQAIRLVDRDDMDSIAQPLDVCRLCARPGADARNTFAAPILPPSDGARPDLAGNVRHANGTQTRQGLSKFSEANGSVIVVSTTMFSSRCS